MITASMPWWLALLIVLLSSAVAAGLVVLDLRRRPVPLEAVLEQTVEPAVDCLLQERLRERFIVTTASGESFDGLLVEVDDRTVVMRDVSVLKADGAAMPVDGEVILRRDAVAYMQRP